MGATLAAGLSLRWYRDMFASGVPFRQLDTEAETLPPGSAGLTFTPYLAGRRSPVMDPTASGGLIILDVMMEQPDDGFFMAQDLRAKGVKTPIIMLTSISSVTGMKYARDNEMVQVDEFIEKPIAPSQLLGKIQNLLEGRE